MQEFNSECVKKVKKPKNLKYLYVCCVKNWCVKYDLLWLALNNKIKILMCDARMKEWVWEKSKETEIFEIFWCMLYEILKREMW
jgi:hypothetical protein